MPAAPSFALGLGRALIAIAWRDGRLEADQREALSDLLFRLPELRPDEWEELRTALEREPDEAEASLVIERFRASLDDGEQRRAALVYLDSMCREESPFSEADRRLATEIREQLVDSPATAFSRWAGKLRGRLREGSTRVRAEIENLRNGEAALRRELPGSLDQRLAQSGILEKLGESEFHRLYLLGSLLGRVAHADQRLDATEVRHMCDALQEQSGLAEDEAKLVCEIGCQRALEALDSYALSREFFLISSESERITMLDLLFALAHSDGEASAHEIEEIRRIRQGFLLSHRHFADARVRARLRAEARGDQSA